MAPRCRRSSLIALVVAASLLTAVPARAQSEAFTIRTSDGTVARIGAFHPRRSPTLASAVRVFGRSSSRKLTADDVCRVEWRRLRLRIDFASFAGRLPGQTTCTPSVGRAQTFTARGTRFRTSAGLRVGSSSSSIAELYPAAQFRSGSWWLVTAVSPFGDQGEFPVIRALVGAGRVRALAGVIGAAGE
jgi:hypothetical protein